MNRATDKSEEQTDNEYYLTALVYHDEGEDNQFKYTEKYHNYSSAKKRLKKIVEQKRKQKWQVKADFKSKPKGNGNVEYMATGNDTQSGDKVHWLISSEPHAKMADGNHFPEFKDVTPKQQFQQQKETKKPSNSFFAKVLANVLMVLKLSPIVIISISFILFWIFFV